MFFDSKNKYSCCEDLSFLECTQCVWLFMGMTTATTTEFTNSQRHVSCLLLRDSKLLQEAVITMATIVRVGKCGD